MASKALRRVAKSGRLNEGRCFTVSSSFRQPHSECFVGIGRIGGGISNDGLDQFELRDIPSNWISCLRHSLSGGIASQAARVGIQNASVGVLIQSRSFAAKAKKSKSKSDEPEVEEDVTAVAKETATKMMDMALDVLSREHSKLRTGRASSGMLDHITVDSHGVRTPLSHIAAVSVSGLQTLSVLPYDPSMVKEVEKALLLSPLGLNPIVEGSILTVPLPRPQQDSQQAFHPLGTYYVRRGHDLLTVRISLSVGYASMCKLALKAGETAKLSIRRARKDALDRVKAAGLSKDEMKRFEKDVEELTKKYVKSTDDICKKKEKEILS
ncbi:hypothetical protein R1sor_020066 [Riccia sorocarpa]|uniref:Ribosome-recycling factor, chloroplastic n=1 Tax=Riccia sorocarpa TaxID=122646 RepID=A0ABD3IHM2_9MARC